MHRIGGVVDKLTLITNYLQLKYQDWRFVPFGDEKDLSVVFYLNYEKFLYTSIFRPWNLSAITVEREGGTSGWRAKWVPRYGLQVSDDERDSLEAWSTTSLTAMAELLVAIQAEGESIVSLEAYPRRPEDDAQLSHYMEEARDAADELAMLVEVRASVERKKAEYPGGLDNASREEIRTFVHNLGVGAWHQLRDRSTAVIHAMVAKRAIEGHHEFDHPLMDDGVCTELNARLADVWKHQGDVLGHK